MQRTRSTMHNLSKFPIQNQNMLIFLYWIIPLSLKELRNCIYALFLCGHYLIQYRFIQVCIFYLFFWKTSFFAFLRFVCFLSVLFFCKICITIIVYYYIVSYYIILYYIIISYYIIAFYSILYIIVYNYYSIFV